MTSTQMILAAGAAFLVAAGALLAWLNGRFCCLVLPMLGAAALILQMPTGPGLFSWPTAADILIVGAVLHEVLHRHVARERRKLGAEIRQLQRAYRAVRIWPNRYRPRSNRPLTIRPKRKLIK